MLSERTSLAVLPLLLLGRATDDYGVCLGFADALVVRLGNLPGVDVLPTSVVLNVPAGATPGEAALRLGVRFVVHGGTCVRTGRVSELRIGSIIAVADRSRRFEGSAPLITSQNGTAVSATERKNPIR